MDKEEAIRRAREHAPYLAESLDLYPDLATAFSAKAPEKIIGAMMDALPELGELETEMSVLRQLKRRVHLITALSDIANIWDWVQVTEQLTALADICMARLMRAVAAEAGIKGTPENPAPGLFILAVGKYGARELNYSSDIDFNVFYDPALITLPNMARAERTLIKFVQTLIRGFESYTPDGYIFRTDLRLRPDPRSNAVAVSTRTAERYYESIGQNWERAAMIKARVCGGDMAAGETFISEVLTPFIWRRNLDYAAIEDIHSIKRQIHAGKGGSDIRPAGHHLKLGKGGIREIEFYAQVQQLILGGRHTHIRTPRSVDALAALTEAGFSEAKDTNALTQHYGWLRKLEHAVQMIRDEQTHIAPEDDALRADLAALAGMDDLAAFDARLKETLVDVHGRYIDLFPDAVSLSSDQGSLVFTGVEPEPATLETFAKLGFENGSEIWRDMADWLGGRIPATRTERARELFTRLAPKLIDICAETGAPDRAFAAFSGFFTQLLGGVSVLSMFLQTPERLAQIIEMMVSSQRVADSLAAKPAILDAMADPNFFGITEGDIADGFTRDVLPDADFETAINAARRRTREDQFRVTAGVLLGSLTLQAAPVLLTQIAESAVQSLLPVAVSETERRYGKIEGDYAVLGLGKLGGGELSLSSDLDIMLIYKPLQEMPETDRNFAKLTQRLISALSVTTEEGGMFEVDMALRPSGRAGPVAVSLDAFERYYAEKAWTWEFMALTRARVVAASSRKFENELSKAVRRAVLHPRPDLDMPVDIADMLARVKREKPPNSPWHIKAIDGGLRDLEFVVQSAYLRARAALPPQPLTNTLAMISFAKEADNLKPKPYDKLVAANVFYHTLRQAFALTQGRGAESPSQQRLEIIARLSGFKNAGDLERKLKYHSKNVTAELHRRVI